MSSKNNQARNRAIKSHGLNDQEVNLMVAKHLRELGFTVIEQAYLLFDKMYGNLVDKRSWLDEETVTSKKFTIHHPDLIIQLKGKILIIELDGDAHIRYSKKTIERNQDYRYAKLDAIIVKQYDLDEIGVSYLDFINIELKNRKLI